MQVRVDECPGTTDNYPLSIYPVQEEETHNSAEFTDVFRAPAEGRIVALDIGMKKVGVAVSDELQFTIKPLKIIQRTNWKKLLLEIREILGFYDAKALVLGLPVNTDGSESEMSQEARRLARNFALSLEIPVLLHDERLTSYTARGRLWASGAGEKKVRARLDSEAAAIILEDFIELRKQKESSR